ncbi:MAG: tetraacyldisaccharide 4'-kinase [Bacteriovoracaceae bacterium]|nr:tetraacyldisaccharide 4'-kinase [Bacteriovoracaceae bacterium]
MKKILFKVLELTVLLPLSALWESVYRFRRFLYNYNFFHSYSFEVPIVSVGNVFFGGTGKTPFSMWLGEYFHQKEKKVMVLMRGYKGNLESGNGILNSSSMVGYNPHDFGDEAILLARRLSNASVVVGKNRAQNLCHYFPLENPDVVVLDDGHQHLKLNRKLNFVLFDSLMSLDKYHTAPRGYLREGLTSLKDVDVIAFGRADLVSRSKINSVKSLINPYLEKDVIFAEFCYEPTGLYNSNFDYIHDLEFLRGKKVICIAGVASPEAFYTSIQNHGADVIHRASFPDHHYFTLEELTEVLALARENQAIVITTEKDIVKMRRVVEDERLLFLEVKVKFLSGQEEIEKRLDQVLKV